MFKYGELLLSISLERDLTMLCITLSILNADYEGPDYVTGLWVAIC